MPSRSMIRTLTSTSSQSSSSAQAPILPPRESSRQSSPQPDALSLSPLSLTKQIKRSTTREHGSEDLEETGYLYSLRVALLQQRLDQAASHPSFTPPLSSPSFLDSSPDLPPSPRSSSRSSPGPMGRRKSSFGLNKKTSDELKLPKQLLIEFWSVLEAENGDSSWTAIVPAFMKQVKKGTKTPRGMNLRHIPVLLDAFSQVALTEPRASQSIHEHQSHLVQLLYNFLPRSSYFSPLARSQSEKDKDLLFRLRAEVQSYMGSQDTLQASAAPSSARLSPSLSADRKSQNSTSSTKHVDYVGMVGEVWGVPQEVMARDIARTGELGPLEKAYLLDLKKTLSVTASAYSALEKSRLANASQQLADLLARFPQLGKIANSEALPPTPPFDPSSSPFVPDNRVKVFHTLRTRVAGRSEELLNACRQIWMIPTRQDLEMEVDTLHRTWFKAVGGADEVKIATSLAPVIHDLVDELQGRPSPALQALQGDLYNLLEESIDTIFPVTGNAPARPPPSLLYLFAAGRERFFSSGAKDLDDVRDRLKGGAVQEYVVAAQAMMEPHGSLSEPQMVAAYAQIASWIESEIGNVKKSWGAGLGDHLDPAGVILGRQLPLFCAELGSLDKPQTSPEMFTLYDSVARLVEMWQDLCPGQELGFEIHSFFEPHVRAWLRQTDTHAVQDTVSRAVGMDNWHPQGEALHSQSVTDLFQFIHASLETVQEDLPLSNYRRGVYLTDLSKIISVAVSQYANTVNALFMAEIAPPKISTPTTELQAKLGGKAGSWLAKGQQAVKSLEKKKIDGFVVAPTACTKLMNICESEAALESILSTVDVPKSSQMKSLATDDTDGGQTITVTITRGYGLFSKGSPKGADAFVVMDHQEASSRLWKTQTVLGTENPRWDESFEVAINKYAKLTISVYDRQLVGKHTLIGSATLKLDKQSFAISSNRDETISLDPRGSVQIRLSTDSQGDGDPQRHLASAMRALERTEKDMLLEIVDRIDGVSKQVLSRHSLDNLGKMVKDKKRPKGALSDPELEYRLGSLFECLNANFLVFSSTMDPVTRISLMIAIWHSILEILISLLVPPLSDQSTSRLPSPQETEIVFKWLQMLKAFFNASDGDGTEHGVPISRLQDASYRDLLMLGQCMDLPRPALKDRCATAVKSATLVTGGNEEKNEEAVKSAEVMLRLARTRPDLGQFLGQQMALLSRARARQ